MISIYGAVNNLSYGLVTINLVDALYKLNRYVQLYPINPHNIECESKYQENIRHSLERAKMFSSDIPCIKIWHQWEHSIFPDNNLRVGFPIFELDRLTNLEKWNLNSLDLLLVCSHWAATVCEENNIKVRTEVVPLGVDSEVFRPLPKKQKNKTVFLCIGKWEKRKGHDVLGQIFNSAFTTKDNVELWLLPTNIFAAPEKTKEWEELYTLLPIGSKIKILPRQNTQEQLNYLINQADFLVSPSRAEGWNLPLLEGMACGIPPITTNYSGHTEFCNSSNSLLVDIQEFEEANDGIWFKPGGIVNQGRWANLGKDVIEQFVNHFRTAHQLNLEQSNKLKGIKEECVKTSEKFSWVNSATKLLNHISHNN